ncbi:MAG: hypothetical protein Q9191_007653 [Dirinaria sp. TL-2023a]
MPRKAFIADLQQAVENLETEHISDLKAGDEDGTITFRFHADPNPSSSSSEGVKISAIVPDVSDYPTSHAYIMCTDSADVPASINTAMRDIGDFAGAPIDQMLQKTAKILCKATAGSRANPVSLDDDPMIIDSSDPDDESEQLQSEDEEDYEDHGISDEWWDPQGPVVQALKPKATFARPKHRAEIIALNQRIRQDLQTAKQAGFRVGHLGTLMNGGEGSFVTVSCRISKLGISEEALRAWHLDPNEYFMLIIRYASGYQTYSQLAQGHDGSGDSVHVRVGLSRRYKISITEAIEAFSKTNDKAKEPNKPEDLGRDEKKEGLMPFFISRPLNDLMSSQLLACLKYRERYAFTWDGAEEYYYVHQGMSITSSDQLDEKYWKEEAPKIFLPKLVTGDHLADLRSQNAATRDASFPLLAMQFGLRHLVRCTEFCLVCHCRVAADFEALRPYVCDKPLCLYQYMALGFGPSIEHEITVQPYVVDLLVSFCYSSASTTNALKAFPNGMGLTVPSPKLVSAPALQAAPRSLLNTSNAGDTPPDKTGTAAVLAAGEHTRVRYSARFDIHGMELIFPPDDQIRPLRLGNWVCVTNPDNNEQKMHCRVIETLYPVVRLSPAIVGGKATNPRAGALVTSSLKGTTITPAATPPLEQQRASTTTKLPAVEFVVYDQNFDELSNEDKQKCIRMLLDTIPGVLEMKEYLQSGRHKTLQSWTDRLSPAALGVLRWIIASNRSCIIQVDNLEGGLRKSEERVSGMPEYMQFRFAQGAPDKEQRFMTSMRSEIPNMSKPQYPTLFAWHGSSLYNWHSIVREGLHFNQIINGRAFGNGVYFSPQANTSLTYSGSLRRYSLLGPAGEETASPSWMWPHSLLRISDALSLNEIINRPEQFQSASPHFVVAQLDWIQTRYLFVRCNNAALTGDLLKTDVVPTNAYAQDPKYRVIGVLDKAIVIPLTAVSKSRRPSTSVKNQGKKKAKLSPDEETVIELSEDTDAEDLEIFNPTAEELAQEPTTLSTASKAKAPAVAATALDPSKTDFRPGTLDHSTLPILQPPSYATSTASRTLQKELAATLKIQDTHAAHELGWYINAELVTNFYQWIVELHSFEPKLPLAKDMKSRGLKSVVLEIRFGGSYPMSPPFVRVIRPRFLSFMAGGGGHVTAGGALCMELLTNSGWSVASNIESVLVQVRAAISSTDPKPARLENGPVRDYGPGEAVEAYIRACQAHGWQVPADFRTNYGENRGAAGAGAGASYAVG